ncbi:MAG TPA: DEAD/DEAH box helicase [Actinomycetota bacterium]|nr:DEAD/DEAH box helicase [Actinomycetota bacterium]
MSESLSVLGTLAGTWFHEAFGEPTPAQELAWPALARGESALVVAPTGSGKTLAAFLVFLDRLAREPPEGGGVRVLYVSPLRALGNDVHRNLEVPLAGMGEVAGRLGEPAPSIRTAIRSGDTPRAERERLVRHPPEVLITTPESLYLMLTSERAARTLATVEAVIVDEVHALAPNKRGTHLAVSLERLAWLAGRPLQRVGLSATVRPAERVAAWLGGREDGRPRPVRVLDAGGRKEIDLLVEAPVEDFRELPGPSVWPSVFDELVRLIRLHRSTLIFVNNRALAERVAAQVNLRAGEQVCRVHHGSVSREKRLEAEELLKGGKLPAMAATSSLELGIDIGSIDLVVQIESPKSVTAGLQRVGRAGHLVGEVASGRVIPKTRPDLLDAAAVARGMLRREVEETHVPEGCLDVLAQQLAGTACAGPWTAGELLELVRGADPYRARSRSRFEAVLGMLAGRYPAARFGELRPRVVWNRETGEVRPRPGTRMLAVTNAGAIPDRGYYRVIHVRTGARLGELDEEFVFEARPGDAFVLGSAVWRIEAIERDEVLVSEAPGAFPSIPFWHGEQPGRPYELGIRVGEWLRECSERLDEPDFVDRLREECALGERAALNLRTFLLDQRDAIGELPSDRLVVVEEFDDELGDRRLIVHSPFGSRVHHAWMLAVRARIRDAENLDVEGVAVDDGFMLRFPGREGPVPVDLVTDLPSDEDLDELLLRELQISPLFGVLFRESAARALLLPRRGPDRRTPLWLQRLRSADLLQLVRRLGDFPVLLEAYREAWDDVLRVRDLRKVADGLSSGEIAVHRVTPEVPSPFAMHFLFDMNMALQYVGDWPRAEWRSQLLAVDRDLLSRVVRPDALRELLDERALEGVEHLLQRLDERSRPRDPDELADALAALGDLSAEEVRRRAGPRWRDLLDALVADGRAVPVVVAGEERWVAREHEPEYRGLEAGDPDAALTVLRRHLAGRGPVSAVEVAVRYGIDEERAAALLTDLQAGGDVAAGEYRPGGSSREWVDVDNLRRIHRETLRVLRKDVEPVDPHRYAAFLLDWHGVGRERDPSAGALPQALERVAGIPVPAASLVADVLGCRFANGSEGRIDDALGSPELAWQGLRGRRVAVMRRDEVELLARPPDEAPGQAARDVERVLAERGALFLSEIARATSRDEAEVVRGLFELVWAGRATNDAPTGMREPRPRPGRPRVAGRFPVYGRWSLLPPLADDPPARAEAWARRLLAAYGVVAREMASAAEVPVPWAAVADALSTMEARGEVRRGYFVRGLSGIQFASARAVEKLRRPAEGRSALVAAADPANPYGPLLPVVGDRPYRLHRVPGAWLVVVDGLPLLAAEAGGRRLVPLAADGVRAAVSLLPELARRLPGGRLVVERWDGQPATAGEAAEALLAAGFSRGPRRMTYRPPLR